MPIRFRCSYCNRLLGIATRKAGTQTRCPHCGNEITVPMPIDDDSKTERMNLDDVEQMLGRGATEVIAEPVVAAAAPPSAPAAPPEAALKPKLVPPTHSEAAPKPINPAERPLFEGDVDAILGHTVAPADPHHAKPPAVSGPDALSLDEPNRHIVLSAQKATLFMVAVVVLMALSFAAGYFLAPKG